MQQKSLMAHLLDKNFIKEYENVANSGIEYLLNEYTEAREVLQAMLKVETVPTFYQAEEALESGKRPDVTGTDANGDRTVMIEGKFGAPLGENQVEDYLEYLSPNGKLLLLCPGSRVSSLGREILERVGSDEARISVRSWIQILELMEEGSRQTDNWDMASDLLQLKAFCQKVGEDDLQPMSVADAEPTKREPPPQIKRYLKTCQYVLKSEKRLASFDRNTKWAPNSDGFGFYFYLGDSIECFVHFSVKKWIKHRKLVWLNVVWDRFSKEKKRIKPGTKEIAIALKKLYPENAIGNDVPLTVKTESSEEVVVNHIVTNINEILTHIKKEFPND